MKKLFLIIFALISLFLPRAVHAQSTEQIQNFEDKININQDGSIAVTEKIEYYFSAPRHGIVRTIPEIKTNSSGKQFKMTYQDFAVTDENGVSYNFTRTDDANIINLKIGDAGRTITGTHWYTVSYKVLGALTYFSDHDELYWNVTGNDWEIPILAARATVTLPANDNKQLSTSVCYTGTAGSTATDCQAGVDGNIFTFTTTKSFGPGEGLTIVPGFPKNIVAVLEPKEIVPFFSTLIGKITGIVIFVLFIFFMLFWYIAYPVIIFVKWYRHGRDPKPPMGVTSAWFDAPTISPGRHLPPGETAALVHQGADREDITATIVDLARRGYLNIVEKKKGDWWFINNNKPKNDEPLLAYEKYLYSGLFTDGDELQLKEADLITLSAETKKQINTQLVADNLFVKDPGAIKVFYTMIGVFAMSTFNIPLTLSAFIFGMSMPKKTPLGAQLEAVAESLRNFLSSQEKKLTFQADKQMMFERLLPYAIAYGVEKTWATRFAAFDIKKPDWYQPYGGGTFNSLIFLSSFNSVSRGFASAMTPTSSSSGFSSGGSGGFSGGGGGGGGGGSW